jgi:hypothetical protein
VFPYLTNEEVLRCVRETNAARRGGRGLVQDGYTQEEYVLTCLTRRNRDAGAFLGFLEFRECMRPLLYGGNPVVLPRRSRKSPASPVSLC